MSTYYKKALVPLDGSAHASLACHHAVSLAKCCDMEIVLLYCYGDLPAAIGGDAREDIIRLSEEEGRAILEPGKKHCEENGVACKAIIRSGGPGRTIVLTSRAEGCDIVIMGSRGLSDFTGMVMGSVSHRVLRHSTIPVLMIR